MSYYLMNKTSKNKFDVMLSIRTVIYIYDNSVVNNPKTIRIDDNKWKRLSNTIKLHNSPYICNSLFEMSIFQHTVPFQIKEYPFEDIRYVS